MKLLVDASLLTYGIAAAYSNISAAQHNPSAASTFDTFDSINPDVYIADCNSITDTVIKNIGERPALKLCIVEKGNDPQKSLHPNYQKLVNAIGNSFLWFHDTGRADLVSFKDAVFNPLYKADIVSIQDELIPCVNNLVLPDGIIFRIFSNDKIDHNNYCGLVIPEIKKHIYKSSKLSISTGDNFYNSALCDCLPLECSSQENILELLNSDNSKQLKFIKNRIYEEANNFMALSEIFQYLGCTDEAKIVKTKMEELI
jgi:hypothetical protein